MDHIIVQLSHFYGTCKIDRARIPLCCWQLSFDFSSDLAWGSACRFAHRARPRLPILLTRTKIDGVLTFDQEWGHTSHAAGSFFIPIPHFSFFVLRVANRMTLFSDQSRAFQLSSKIPYHKELGAIKNSSSSQKHRLPGKTNSQSFYKLSFPFCSCRTVELRNWSHCLGKNLLCQINWGA